MPVVFFLNRLRPGVSASEYERWVRAVDYPTARGLVTVKDYRVARVNGLLDGSGTAPYDYVERVELTDLEDYRRELRHPEMKDFSKQWSAFVGESTAVYGQEIDG
ncbi:MAG: hypothetical protein ACYDAG_17170 [Chloroflexota bacterium]